MYYEGTSVQNINKELRRAVLGNCWEYDIRSSVVAWKMGWAKQCIHSRGQGEELRKVFSATINFLEDKADFMGTVQYFTFRRRKPSAHRPAAQVAQAGFYSHQLWRSAKHHGLAKRIRWVDQSGLG